MSCVLVEWIINRSKHDCDASKFDKQPHSCWINYQYGGTIIETSSRFAHPLFTSYGRHLLCQCRRTRRCLRWTASFVEHFARSLQETKDYIAYVAKDNMNKRACHVLLCQDKESLDVITTIGQAFELRYNEYLQSQQQATDQHEYVTADSSIYSRPWRVF